MTFRKLMSLLCALIMAFSVCCAGAESESPRTLTYTGGVVLRSIPRGTEDSDLLQLAYTLTDMPYIILGESYIWDLFVSGGTAPYSYEVLLAHQADLSMDQFEDDWSVPHWFDTTDSSFFYTFTEEGRYFWEITVTDSAGQSLTYQTRIYEAYTTEDEAIETTVAGKVNAIIDELITDDMSDYSRALALHDWLIYNANYDYTYTNYDAAGVLLYGTGVCDSYARAYLMLCTAAGLECVYVGGTAGSDADPAKWGAHGWNLVRLGGSWYHVDCTWDDPNEGGGYERHDYFCLDDEAMAKDHRWNQPDDLFDKGSMLVPDAEGGELEPGDGAQGDYDFTFSTMEEYNAAFDALVASGVHLTVTKGRYTGTEDASTIWASFQEWGNTQYSELRQANLVNGGGFQTDGVSIYGLKLYWSDPTDYLRIDETNLVLTVGETATIVPAEVNEGCGTFTWTSSDPSVATVSAVQSGTAITATITGVNKGTATITATSADGLTDSLTVTVLGAYQPEFNLTLSRDSNGVLVDWDGIPGATAYFVMRRCNGVETTLAAQSEVDVYISDAALPANVRQEVYIIAKRGSALSYTSESVTYGTLTITYESTLPADATAIADEAFAGSSLTTVYIPDGVTSIGSRAFADCTALTAVRLPANDVTIAADAFTGCTILYVEVAENSSAAAWAGLYLSGAEIIPE